MLFYLQPTVMIVVYDIECLSNLFTCTYYEIKNKKFRSFVIHESRNDIKEFVEYTRKLTGMIGYNNIDYDYKVIHPLISQPDYKISGKELAKKIYNYSSGLIEDRFKERPEHLIPQRDLFRIWHYNNKARMTSLKKLEIAMRYENVQDMPYSHDSIIDSIEQVREILDYNLNDVKATYDFYNKTREKLDLRRGLYQKYGLRCMNFPDTKIGEELTLKLYCEATGEDISEVRKRRTYREVFKFKECFSTIS